MMIIYVVELDYVGCGVTFPIYLLIHDIMTGLGLGAGENTRCSASVRI